jgi:chromosome segregation ATPase
MVSILNNYNQIFDIIENKTSLLEDNLLVIKKENQRIVLDNIRINQKIDKVELDLLKKDEEIKGIKEDNKKKDSEIKELRTDIQELKEDNKRKDQEIKELRTEIKELKFDKIKNKIFEALSDIINNDNLENQISEIYDDLNYLKSSRNNLCHYIRDKDSKDIKNKKIAVTIDVLKNISIEIKNELISEFDNDIIEKIIDYYEKNKLFINSSNISQKELIRINNWWK